MENTNSATSAKILTMFHPNCKTEIGNIGVESSDWLFKSENMHRVG